MTMYGEKSFRLRKHIVFTMIYVQRKADGF